MADDLTRKRDEIEQAHSDAVIARNSAKATAEHTVQEMLHDLASKDLEELDVNMLRAQADTLADQVARYQEREAFVGVTRKLRS